MISMIQQQQTTFINQSQSFHAHLRRIGGPNSRLGGGGGQHQFLFSRRLYDVNKGEESSLCDLLLDSDSGGPSFCGSSTGSSLSTQKRRASTPFSHQPHYRAANFRQYRYKSQSQLEEGSSRKVVLRTERNFAAPQSGVQSQQRRVFLLNEGAITTSATGNENQRMTTLVQQKPQVIIGGRGGQLQENQSNANIINVGGKGRNGGEIIIDGHPEQVTVNIHQLSSSSPVKSEPPHHLYSCPHNERLTSPTVRINLGEGKIFEGPRPTDAAKIQQINKNLFEKGEHGKQRKWQTHQGRNRFFYDGRFIMARQSSIFLLTLFLILLTMTLFCVFDLPYLTTHVTIFIPIVASVLFLLVISSLFKTALSDPGIIPRAEPREVLEWERQCRETDPFFQNDEWVQPRTRVVNIRGQPIKLKYCFTCCIFRPPRSSHCSICDNCVLNFDHHCPWLGNCIGLRNYRHFYIFIISLSLLDAFIGICVFLHLYLLSHRETGFMGAIRDSPPSMLTGLINVISIWSVLGLSGFHTYLLALGQTTNEDIKGTFNRKLHPQVWNPYSTGNCIKNILQTICSPERPSLLNRRGWNAPKDGPSIYIDTELLNKLAIKNRQSRDQNYLSLLVAERCENNRSTPSLINLDGERRKQQIVGREDKNAESDVSSCPSSPPRQRRSNSTRMRELFKQSQENSQKVIIPTAGALASSTNSLERNHQYKSRICHSNNLIAPIENIPPKSSPARTAEKEMRADLE